MLKSLTTLSAAAAIGVAALTMPTSATAQPWIAPVVVGSVIAGGIVGAAMATPPYTVTYGYPAPACNCLVPEVSTIEAPAVVYYQPTVQPYYQVYAQPYYQVYAQPYYQRYARPYYSRYASSRPYGRRYVQPYYPVSIRSW